MDLARYLVELSRLADGSDALPGSIDAARQSATDLAAAGEPVRVLRSVYVPEDDAWFLLVEAPSAEHVERLVQPLAGSVASIAPALKGSQGVQDASGVDGPPI